MVKRPRKEFESNLTGSATFVEDLDVSDQLHMGFLRSPLAHARITGIDTSGINLAENHIGVFTRSDLEDLLKPDVWREFPLAETEVVYQGQPVVAVVASGRQALEDCLERITVAYEPLPVVSDPGRALGGRDRWLSNASSNVILQQESKHGRPDEALRRSPHRLDLRFRFPRISPYSIEGRGIVVEHGPSFTVVYSPTQSPHQLKQFLLDSTNGLAEVRVIQTAIGGAFGGKIWPHAEDLACYLVATRLRRSVKWIPLPAEKLVTLTHRPNQIHEVQVGYDGSGRILALKDDAIVDAGAYFGGSAGGSLKQPGIGVMEHSTPIDQMVSMFTGPYDISNVETRVTAVATNKVMMGPIRGSGFIVASFLLERVMNQIAMRLGLDQFAVRKINLISADLPDYTNSSGKRIPQLRFLDLLEKARTSRATGMLIRRSLTGKGLKIMGYGLSFYLAESAPPSAETVRLELTKSGKLVLSTSVAPSGQGVERTLAAIISKEFHLGKGAVEVRFGDTTTSHVSIGTYYARSLTYAGSASLIACQLLIGRIKRRLLTARHAPGSVTFRAGVFHLRYEDGGSRDLNLSAVPGELGGGVAVEATYRSKTSTFSTGCHISLVEVDGSTGSVKLLRHLTFDDFGMVLDFPALTAQTEGGVLQSLGEAFLETIEYDRDGRVKGSYSIPAASAAPIFSHNPIRLTTSQHLHGARGAGEAGRIGSMPAIVNALENALSKSRKDIFLPSLPVTDESVHALTQGV